MIKVKDSIEEQPLNYYYLYVRNLKVLNHIASKPTPDKLKIEVIFYNKKIINIGVYQSN